METILKPCPFCGAEAEVEREGTSRQSCVVKCTECHCTLESNEVGFGKWWNRRFNNSKERKAIEEAVRTIEEETASECPRCCGTGEVPSSDPQKPDGWRVCQTRRGESERPTVADMWW